MENTKSQKKSYSTASSKSRARRKTKTDYYDYSLVAVIVLLTCFGLIMLYSTSSYMAQINYGSDMYFFKKQAIISVACIIMALIISRLNYRILNRFSTALYVAALVLMALVKTPLGQSSHGAQRWLNLGPVQFQPAELAKIAVIVCLPYMIVHMGKKVHTLKGCMVLAVVGGGLALAAYVFTDNLSTAIIIFCITAGLIFVAHPDIKIFIIIAGVVIALAVIGVIFLNATVSVDGSGSFRLRRIMVWLHPEEYADNEASEHELGDFLFSVINAARLYRLNPDNALEHTNHKFIRRFNYVEQQAKVQGRSIKELTLEEMDRLWDEAKQKEKKQE